MKRVFLCHRSYFKQTKTYTTVLPDGTEIVLFKTWRGYYAIENRCPHAGATLQDSLIRRNILTCIWHGWQYHLKTGRCITDPQSSPLKHFPLEIENGNIYLYFSV